MLPLIQPTHPLLRHCIDFFYLSPATHGAVSYAAFPNVNTCLSFFRHAHVAVTDNEITISPAPDSHCAIITGMYTQPAFVHYTAPVTEIAIVLKPLGLHYLLPHAGRYVGNSYGIPFTEPGWQQAIHAAFDASSSEEAITALEAFLVSQLQTPQIEPIKATTTLLEQTNDTITHIASHVHLHKKTLERLFIATIGCTPATYRRIVRFRRSVDMRLMSQHMANLTDVAHTSRYYDQSYFVREYRKLTGSNPGTFFAQVTAFERSKIVWMLR